MRHTFRGAAVSEKDTARAILATLNETGELIDPHTAVAVHAARELARPGTPTVILSTAHPAKFPDAVTQAIGAPPPEPKRLAGLANLPERLDNLAPDAALLKEFIFSRLTP
jgi:threonine synthase